MMIISFMSSPSLRIVALCLFVGSACAQGTERVAEERSHWKTEWERRSIELSELTPGGPPKDGIPSIDNPSFIPVEAAQSWLQDREPVVSLVIKEEARAYPLQIDIASSREIGSTGVFDRRIDGRVLHFDDDDGSSSTAKQEAYGRSPATLPTGRLQARD